MGEHQTKWYKTMLERHGSDEAIKAFMAKNGNKAKRTGKGGFKYMKQHNPDKLKVIASLGGKSGTRAKKLET